MIILRITYKIDAIILHWTDMAMQSWWIFQKN